MNPILQLKQIRKSYNIGTSIETEILHGIDIELSAGSFSALTGPSGSGKSTLLNIIGLLEPPTSGELVISGQSTQNISDDQLTKLRGLNIGFVFQFHHLLPAFNALENVMMPSIIHQQLEKNKAERRAQQLLNAVGLASATQKKPNELSGGMQQRVAIARALMLNPPLVLADEPTGNLDTHSADDIFKLLERINQTEGISFLIVTHDMKLAQRCSSRFHLVDGCLSQSFET
ncbi:MAG: ABC transporter ATP-binding protein [Gammaproteobacteria bacterium]|nr:ABC transporter ATP-binding protein [Gammaproteobacteria bacterium]OYZ09879.1 MAG: ABC transporter ATP-binding protein [Thiotrichales bacterium 16-46-22]OZA20426.1 MAG: ABC transporter ATP-binding protein [Thiotrichales bacterium 17-46-47]OZA97533.1 MAG: ABC transporter ATP-binding protein [Thiotrichales bacterium 34-46-19]HQT01595.1 ABC transporter ATP-binding protein [Thiotrichales bacterium]